MKRLESFDFSTRGTIVLPLEVYNGDIWEIAPTEVGAKSASTLAYRLRKEAKRRNMTLKLAVRQGKVVCQFLSQPSKRSK
ncbi:MAG: hypothetical protein KatS3mg087_1164 [Patescibacteria group bacterium]|nr:MAG: hypothetical protein KatS3mg087_1164 [Patescibacteria group bacterium]